MAKVIDVDEFKKHVNNLADKAVDRGEASAAIAFRALIEIMDVYVDIYGKEA